MKKLSLTALLFGAGVFVVMGATSLSAEGMKCGAGKCGASMTKPAPKRASKCGDSKEKRNSKYGDDKEMNSSKCGDSKKSPMKNGKCGTGKCS